MDNGGNKLLYVCPDGHSFRIDYVEDVFYCIKCGKPNLRKPEVEEAFRKDRERDREKRFSSTQEG